MSYTPPPGAPQQYAQAPMYVQPVENQDETFGSWMLTIFLTFIPVVGFIYTLILAFGSNTSPSRRNWARATLAWMVVGLVLTVLSFIFFGAAILATLPHSSY